MHQHTKGPWTLQHLESEHNGYADWPTYCVRDSVSSSCLAVVGAVDHATGPDNAANAQLMTMAPAMFDALLALLTARHDGSGAFRSRSYDSDIQAVFDLVEKMATN